LYQILKISRTSRIKLNIIENDTNYKLSNIEDQLFIFNKGLFEKILNLLKKNKKK